MKNTPRFRVRKCAFDNSLWDVFYGRDVMAAFVSWEGAMAYVDMLINGMEVPC